MAERRKNPFLPKKTGIHWRTGTAKGMIGLPPIPEASNQTDQSAAPRSHRFPDASRSQGYFGAFDMISNAGWGAAPDLIAPAHEPVGSGRSAQAERAALLGREQGVETFQSIVSR